MPYRQHAYEGEKKKKNKSVSKSNRIIMVCLYGMYEAQEDKV